MGISPSCYVRVRPPPPPPPPPPTLNCCYPSKLQGVWLKFCKALVTSLGYKVCSALLPKFVPIESSVFILGKLSSSNLLVPRTEDHLSSFKCGFLNIFSSQNLLRSLSRLLFLLRSNKNGAKKCLKNHIPFDV